MISSFDIKKEEHQRVLAAMATMSRTKEWTTINEYLEKELHTLDVNQRMANPLACSRLGAAAFTLQTVLDKFNHAIDLIQGKTVIY